MSIAINKDFIIKLGGREYILYRGLLDLAHQKGIAKVEVDIVQLPAKENNDFAVCKASVTAKDGGIYTDVGDACNSNCSRLVARHILRMAATRAIARALRTMTNTGMTCLEELGGNRESFEKKKVEKDSITGLPAKEQFKKALPRFKDDYGIKESHLLGYVGKKNASDIEEDDITKISQLWLELNSDGVKAEAIIGGYYV